MEESPFSTIPLESFLGESQTPFVGRRVYLKSLRNLDSSSGTWFGCNTVLERCPFLFSLICFLLHNNSFFFLFRKCRCNAVGLQDWDYKLYPKWSGWCPGLSLGFNNQIPALSTGKHIPPNSVSSPAGWSRKEVQVYKGWRKELSLVNQFCWLSKVLLLYPKKLPRCSDWEGVSEARIKAAKCSLY